MIEQNEQDNSSTNLDAVTDANIAQEKVQNNAENTQKKPKIIEIVTSSSVFRYFLAAMVIFGVCFISSFFVFNIVMTPVEVRGYSMYPTINKSAQGMKGTVYTDHVYIVGSTYYKYKDIVVIKGGKTSSGEDIIKRVIATPSDTITFKKVADRTINTVQYYEVEVYINGTLLTETYTNEGFTLIEKAPESSSYYTFHNQMIEGLRNGEFSLKLGADEYFVMGDNRNSYASLDEHKQGSTDSRMFGPVKKSEIVGKVRLHVRYGNNLIQAIWHTIFGCKLVYQGL